MADWGPDGKSLAVVRHDGREPRLEYPIGKVLGEGLVRDRACHTEGLEDLSAYEREESIERGGFDRRADERPSVRRAEVPRPRLEPQIVARKALDDVGRSQEARQAFHRAHVRLQEVGANLRDERLRAAFAKSAELRFVQQVDVPSA